MKKDKKRRIAVIIIIILLLSVVFSGFDTLFISNIRNLDVAKIFAIGVLTGVLLSTLRTIYLERRGH